MNLKSGIWMLMMAVTFPLFAQSGRQFINLTDSKDFSGMQILDADLKSKRIMVVGINRYYPEITRTVSTKLISYAKKTAGYRYVLAPVSPICGEWLDRFVYQNDNAALVDLTTTLNQQDVIFYKRLNTLNEGLPDSSKIRIIGIDAENQLLIPALSIHNLLKDKTPPDNLRIPIEALQGAIHYQQLKAESPDPKYNKERFPVKNTFITFANSFDTLKTAYQQWLGDDEWFRLEALMRGLKSAIMYDELKNTSLEDPYRVQQVSENMAMALKNLPGERFVSVIGRCYASKTRLQGSCDLFDFSPVCSKLSEDSIIGSQIFNVGVYYNDIFDSEDEPPAVLSALKEIRTGVADNAVSISRWTKPDASTSFDYMLVMGNTKEKPQDLELPIVKSTPLLSAGLCSGIHLLNYSRLNTMLADNGLPKALPMPDFGVQFSFQDKGNNQFTAGFFQRASDPGSAYHYWGTFLSGVSNIVPENTIFQGGFGSYLSYQQHYVSKPYTQSDTLFISRFTLPTVAVNPIFAIGITAKGQLNLNRFYISAEAGYGWDVSDRRWRVNNLYSGPMGKFKGDQVFVNVSAGIHLFTQKQNARKDKP